MDDEFDSKSTLNFKFENVAVYNFSEIEAMGKSNKQYSFVDTKPDDIFTLVCKCHFRGLSRNMYTYNTTFIDTSGSTGDPKGVIILEKVWHSNLTKYVKRQFARGQLLIF
jgi:acyl-CoA synthetase (AMP-forming)/AMP-acid ligase II